MCSLARILTLLLLVSCSCTTIARAADRNPVAPPAEVLRQIRSVRRSIPWKLPPEGLPQASIDKLADAVMLANQLIDEAPSVDIVLDARYELSVCLDLLGRREESEFAFDAYIAGLLEHKGAAAACEALEIDAHRVFDHRDRSRYARRADWMLKLAPDDATAARAHFCRINSFPADQPEKRRAELREAVRLAPPGPDARRYYHDLFRSNATRVGNDRKNKLLQAELLGDFQACLAMPTTQDQKAWDEVFFADSMLSIDIWKTVQTLLDLPTKYPGASHAVKKTAKKRLQALYDQLDDPGQTMWRHAERFQVPFDE